MSDNDMGDSAPAEDCSCASDTSMDCPSPDEPPSDCSSSVESPSDCSSSVEPPPDCSCSVNPPPDYESCVSATTNTHSHQCCPISEDSPAGASSVVVIDHTTFMTDDILHDTVLSHPILHVTPASEHRHHTHVPSFSHYNPRPSHKPSSMINRSRASREEVYRDCVLALDRLEKYQARTRAAKSTDLICRWGAVATGVITCLIVVAAIARLRNY